MMDIKQLHEVLRCLWVRSTAYSLNDQCPRDDRDCITEVSDGFEVYFFERGKKEYYVKYDTESEACLELLNRVLVGELTAKQLHEVLQYMWVRPESYSVNGKVTSAKCECLVKLHQGWEVYLFDNGLKKKQVKFDTESEACFEMLKRLV